MRLRIRPRAIALVTTLLFTVILAMMVGAMLFATSGQKGLTLHYHQTVSALYVAEAGVSDAMARLTADPDWAPTCLLYTSPSPRDRTRSRMPSSA